MAQLDRTTSPPVNAQLSSIAKSTSHSSLSPLRQRPLNRASTFADGYPSLRPRRSSTFSDSAQSFKSSTDNILLPRARDAEEVTLHEESHWQSVPLLLALLPAVGGLVFKNGGAVVTDVTLLALAAVFLNWSVRLPWDWYRSAQEVTVDDTPPLQTYKDHSSIIEEESEEDSQASRPTSPGPNGEHEDSKSQPKPSPTPSRKQMSAAGELRIHELLALLTCFISPMVGAWLLHHIRAQLSRPSEGLVSNYNLTIFLLASELRPLSHLIKLVQARTLFLQRIVASNPYQSPNPTESINDLTNRVTQLESNTTNNPPKSPNTIQQQQTDLLTATRKSLQPDLDALNRAVRRYEKKATLLTMQTESRLQDLEKKLSDAITLAAAAERSSQASKQRRGSVVLVEWVSAVLLLPVQIAWAAVSLPGKVLGAMAKYVEDVVGMRVRREIRTAGKGEGEKKRVGRGQKKQT